MERRKKGQDITPEDLRSYRQFLKSRGCGHTLSDEELAVSLESLQKALEDPGVQKLISEDNINKN